MALFSECDPTGSREWELGCGRPDVGSIQVEEERRVRVRPGAKRRE